MSHTLDDIAGYLEEGLSAIAARDSLKLHNALMAARSITLALIGQQDIWHTARQLYEEGMRPAAISAKTGLNARQVTRRAHRQAWKNEKRETLILRRGAKKLENYKTSQDFKKTCIICQHDFRAKSGKAHYCNRCEMDRIKTIISTDPKSPIAKSWESWGGTAGHIV